MDFRALEIIPSDDEFLAKPKEQNNPLPVNKVEKPYRDVREYLDTHFRLLREDLLAPYRQGVYEFRKLTELAGYNNNNNNNNKLCHHDLHVYSNVRLLGMRAERDGVEYVVKFDVEGHNNQVLDWGKSKLVMFNSLLCISSDGFHSFFWAVVSTRRLRSLYTDTAIGLRPLYGLELNMKDGVEYTMFESTSAFFEAYQNVLKALQKPQMENLCFLQHLVDLKPIVAEPEYLISENKYIGGESHEWDQSSPFPDSDLDYSQAAAIEHGLSKELAIIQGPAGTGKTFVGLFITKELLANSNICGPIVIVCYTNRALDQFLEGILKYETSLVRLGTGSKSHKLNQCSLGKLRKNPNIRVPKNLCREASRLGSIKDYMATKMNLCAGYMNAKVVSKDSLCRIAKEEHIDSLYFCNDCWADDLYGSWLAGKQRVHPTSTCPLFAVEALPSMDTVMTSTVQNSFAEIIEIPDDDDEDDGKQRVLPTSSCPLSVVDTTITGATQNSSAEIIVIPDDDDDESSGMSICSDYIGKGDIWNSDVGSRLKLHQHWLSRIRQHGKQEFWDSAPEYANICRQLSDIRAKIQMYLLNRVKVLGMTTTVAARYYDTLQRLQPQVMIVEEAAEVLESQILACLNPYIKHLILIGDHKQLRPSIATSKLAYNHHLDVSLFERLVRNGIEYKALEVQRRMRPEIAYLLSSFYPTLKNHPSVETIDNVKGIRHNVFFLDHRSAEECVDNSGSRLNSEEAELVVEFCMYLMKRCGYSSQDITVLSMYRSQINEISKRFRQHIWPRKRALVKQGNNGSDVPKVRSVDEFQGEESNIIILSLVRNTTFIDHCSPLETIGFLGIPNRICMALSRARMGLYIFGNAMLLSGKSKTWNDIIERLGTNGWIGSRMRLFCPNHPTENEFRVRTPEDFRYVCKNLCHRKCEEKLHCGHPCPRNCHMGSHENMYCRRQCRKKLEWCGHLCMKTCHSESSEECSPCSQCSCVGQWQKNLQFT